MTNEEIYKKNKARAKRVRILKPILKIVLICLALIFLLVAVRNSLGNLLEIVEKLDKKKYTETQLVANYQSLIAKWGEWEVIGADKAGLVIRYVNIANAMFSGLMITFSILFAVTVFIMFVLDKIVFPIIIKGCETDNEDLVNLTSLRTAEKIGDIEQRLGVQNDTPQPKKPKRKEWF